MNDAERLATFPELLKTVMAESESTQQKFAEGIGYSTQYVNDLINGRRLPSVNVTDAICAYMGRGPIGAMVWHTAAARAHGWKIQGAAICDAILKTLGVNPRPEILPRSTYENIPESESIDDTGGQ